MQKNQMETCSADHSASKTPEDAARWCQMFHGPEATFSDLTPDQLAKATAQGEAARERFNAAERARHSTPTYHSDALGAVTIPEDDR